MMIQNLSYKKIIKVHKGLIDNYNGWTCIKLSKTNFFID